MLLKCKGKEGCLAVAVCRRRIKLGTNGNKEEAGPLTPVCTARWHHCHLQLPSPPPTIYSQDEFFVLIHENRKLPFLWNRASFRARVLTFLL